ncbi:hypothetical protein [Desulforamulus reducens]|nr:hypothetical protein [Desulforamulus reducens]
MKRQNNNKQALKPKPYKVSLGEIFVGEGSGGCRKEESKEK